MAKRFVIPLMEHLVISSGMWAIYPFRGSNLREKHALFASNCIIACRNHFLLDDAAAYVLDRSGKVGLRASIYYICQVCVVAKSQGSKLQKQEWRAGHLEGAGDPMKSVYKHVFQCLHSSIAQQKTQANRRRTKMAPPKLEVHGGKTGFTLSTSHCNILQTTDRFKLCKVDKGKVKQEEDTLRKSFPSITTDRVFQACCLTFN